MRASFFATFAFGWLSVLAACSDDSSTAATPGPDAGAADAPAESAPVQPGANEVKQTGKIVRALSTETGVASTITIGGKSIATNADGTYEVAVPKGTPYQMTVAAPDYYKLIEQEWIAGQDLPNGETQMLPVSLANILAGGLDPPRDTSKGLLVVSVKLQPPCTSEEGTTLAIDPPGSAKVSYVNGNFPSDRTSVKAGESFSAFFYDVEPGVTIRVTATSPTCQQVPFPIEVDGKTLTGNQKTEGGETLSFLRVYLGPLK